MSPPTLIFENNHKLAHALSEAIPSLGGPTGLALRPFNRFSTAFTTWWFVPVKDEWPAYHLCKLCLYPLPSPEGQQRNVLAGIQIEKGVTPKLADLPDVNPTHVLRPHWRWNSLTKQSFIDQIVLAVIEILSRSSRELTTMMDVYAFNRVPNPEAPAREPDDRALWNIQDQSLALMPTSKPGAQLAEVSASRDLQSLLRMIPREEPLEYFWLDLRIGLVITLSTELPTGDRWDVPSLWRNAFEPWVPLLSPMAA